MSRSSLPTNYGEAQRALGARASRKIANNTYLEVWGSDIGVRLHRTVIVVFQADGAIRLDNGGWDTTTTRDRMNRCLPGGWRVERERGDLCLSFYCGGDRIRYTWSRRVDIYADGSTNATPWPKRTRKPRAVAAEPVVTTTDASGADDARVPEPGLVFDATIHDPARWAEYNRKFNDLIYGRS
jgi:hypothetical protein